MREEERRRMAEGQNLKENRGEGREGERKRNKERRKREVGREEEKEEVEEEEEKGKEEEEKEETDGRRGTEKKGGNEMKLRFCAIFLFCFSPIICSSIIQPFAKGVFFFMNRNQ